MQDECLPMDKGHYSYHLLFETTRNYTRITRIVIPVAFNHLLPDVATGDAFTLFPHVDDTRYGDWPSFLAGFGLISRKFFRKKISLR
jgi:hypothetical protein